MRAPASLAAWSLLLVSCHSSPPRAVATPADGTKPAAPRPEVGDTPLPCMFRGTLVNGWVGTKVRRPDELLTFSDHHVTLNVQGDKREWTWKCVDGVLTVPGQRVAAVSVDKVQWGDSVFVPLREDPRVYEPRGCPEAGSSYKSILPDTPRGPSLLVTFSEGSYSWRLEDMAGGGAYVCKDGRMAQTQPFAEPEFIARFEGERLWWNAEELHLVRHPTK